MDGDIDRRGFQGLPPLTKEQRDRAQNMQGHPTLETMNGGGSVYLRPRKMSLWERIKRRLAPDVTRGEG